MEEQAKKSIKNKNICKLEGVLYGMRHHFRPNHAPFKFRSMFAIQIGLARTYFYY